MKNTVNIFHDGLTGMEQILKFFIMIIKNLFNARDIENEGIHWMM